MERREVQRHEISESVLLTVLQHGQPRYGATTVVDISPTGYRTLSAAELPIGAEVLINLNSVAIVGRVRHCEPFEAGSFTIAVEITKVVREESLAA